VEVDMSSDDFVFIDKKKLKDAEYLIYRAYEKLKYAKELSKTKFLNESLYLLYQSIFTGIRAILYKNEENITDIDSLLELLEKYKGICDSISKNIGKVGKEIVDIKNSIEKEKIKQIKEEKLLSLINNVEEVLNQIRANI
jgi:HEPN domain-containing protein